MYLSKNMQLCAILFGMALVGIGVWAFLLPDMYWAPGLTMEEIPPSPGVGYSWSITLTSWPVSRFPNWYIGIAAILWGIVLSVGAYRADTD